MAEALKNQYNEAYIDRLAASLAKQQKGFRRKAFKSAVLNEDWPDMELKQRMHHIAGQVHGHLKGDYKTICQILREIAPEFPDYMGMFLPHIIETHGLSDWPTSMRTLEQITPWASGEFAIRQFILKDPERAMKQMQRWSRHKNYHVRRLASEGCRPRLPWACALPAFKEDPRPILPIIAELKTDPELYVRRSVANNINDISKDNPEIVLDLVRLWRNQHPDTDWILKHGCRTLLKQGNKNALHLFELPPAKHVQLEHFRADKSVTLGSSLHFDFELQSNRALGKLRIEYRIDFLKASGKYGSKVFKLAEADFTVNKRRFRGKRNFRQYSTRKHHPGKHQLTLLINGKEVQQHTFQVKGASRSNSSKP